MSAFDDIWKKATGKEGEKKKEIIPDVPVEAVAETVTEVKPLVSAETEKLVKDTLETMPIETAKGAKAEEVSQSLWGESVVTEEPSTKKVEVVIDKAPEQIVETSIEGTKAPEQPSTVIETVGIPIIQSETTPKVPGSLTITVDGETYSLRPDKGTTKLVITVYGRKGEGKTGLAFSFPGIIACLSFDRKSVQVWKEQYKSHPRIAVYDAVENMSKTSGAEWLRTADKTLKFVNLLLERLITPTNPDWIVIDGTEIFTQICEMVMRYQNGLQPYQGIANRNLWKERRMYIDQLHNKCIGIAKKGVIYTTYVRKDEIKKDGDFVTIEDVPKWVDAVMYYTDVVIRVRSQHSDEGAKFLAIIESSKIKKLPTGKIANVTNGGYENLVV